MGAYSDVDDCNGIDPNPDGTCTLQNAPYEYIPTLWLGILFTVLFAIELVLHLVFSLWPGRFRRGGFMLLAAVCAAGEVAGWVSRLYSHYKFFKADPYIAQLVSLIISPIFVSAANYVALERVIFSVGPELARIPTKIYIGVFVTGDIISLIVQAVGGGMSATADTDSGVHTGSNIALAGVIIQTLITGPFLILLSDFLIRHLIAYRAGKFHERWTRGTALVGAASFISSIFILIRCIYRCVEMKQGWTGYLSTHEVWFPIFDATMIFFALVVFLPFHPSFFLPAPWSQRSQILGDPDYAHANKTDVLGEYEGYAPPAPASASTPLSGQGLGASWPPLQKTPSQEHTPSYDHYAPPKETPADV